MKKIEFGFANEKNPKGSWQGLGINPNLLLIDADYYGAIRYEEDFYIVAKVVEDQYNRFPQYLNNFIVRPAIVDLYPDGGTCLYLDQEENYVSKKIENILNDVRIKDRISNVTDIIRAGDGIYPALKSFDLAAMDEKIISISITHEAFEDKKYYLKECHGSFVSLQEQISKMNGYSR